MTQYYFVCSIGPVQPFIAAARSSHDLAYGSWLLSELAKTAARTIAEKESFDALIFPAPVSEKDLKQGSDLSVANKVVAVVQGDLKEVAKEIEQAVRQHLLGAWESVEKELGKGIDSELARRQLKDLLEFYWAAAPLSSPDGYKDARKLCEAALNARKATRDFRPYQGAPRFKSSIDGWREHVLSTTPDRHRPPKPNMQRYKLRNGELLSGVDLLKRWGELPNEERYKSVSHIAALPFAQGLGEEKAKELQRQLYQIVRRAREEDKAEEKAREEEYGDAPVNDYSVFFPSEVRAAIDAEQTVERILEAQQQLLTKYAGRRRPGPYYALLLADGDFMGKVIDVQETADDHRRFSRALSEFARQVPKIVEAHHGVTVYAGGDDILAYLPLHTALDCVKELAAEFAQKMAGFTFTDDDGHEKSPTLSAGLVIAHHLEPLSDVLALVRRTEGEAKEVPGKNALAVALNKRSGAERTVRGGSANLVERLHDMTTWWMDGTLSKGTAYELERLAREMEGVLREDALRAEAMRILKRKRESGGQEQVKKKVLEKVEAWLKHEKIKLYELAQEMIIAAELARARKQAEGKEA